MQIARTLSELQSILPPWHQRKTKTALIATMGALHAGHLSLIHTARKQQAEYIITSIFVNPTQFAPNEDFANYPRQEQQDITALQSANIDLLYIPTQNEIYSPDFGTAIKMHSYVAQGLCATTRPHFFDGVALIVTKLLLQTMPHIAIFGEKDYQQLLVIKRLVADLDIPVKIVGSPIIREPDGLALSSRNQYLSTSERNIAPQLYSTLKQAARQLEAPKQPIEQIINAAKQKILAAGFGSVDYIELRKAHDLYPVTADTPSCSARLLAAAYIGKTRLIDNVALKWKGYNNG